MSTQARPILGRWMWRCPACGDMLLWVRDNFQGRRLLAVLLHEAEATAEELIARGILSCEPDAHAFHGASITLCCCEDHRRGED